MNRTLRIAVLGLDNSHPFVDAANLRTLRPDVEFVVVANSAEDRVQRFLDNSSGAQTVPDMSEALATGPDAFLVTLRPTALVATLPELAASRIPTFINKQGIATRVQLAAAWPHLVSDTARFMTCSVLRHATGLPTAGLGAPGLERIRLRIAHSVGHWSKAGNEWQAEIDEGGAVVGSLGYHGLELADRLVGPGFIIDSVETRASVQLAGGDRAIITGHWPDGTDGVIQLDTTVEGECYEAEFVATNDVERLALTPSLPNGFGYQATMAAFLDFVEGASPLDWSRSLDLIRTAADAHHLAYKEK